jgi:hypothetical protein
MIPIPIDRQILALTDAQLEQFVRDWTSYKSEYVKVQRFTGSGDMGRDVVGFLTKKGHEGPWHNYQCKQYARTLPTATALAELGKILYFSFRGEFTSPTAYYFVAPRGMNRKLKRYLSKPGELKDAFLNGWNQNCADRIVKDTHIALTPELCAHIETWDFSSVHSISVDEILEDGAGKPVLQKWFGVDPGPAPLGVVPDEITASEAPYIQELLDAYGEREACVLNQAQAANHPRHSHHLSMQRERFFDADAFNRFYRDNTMQDEIDILRRDIRHGIDEVHRAAHSDSLSRADAVMTQAANLQPSGALARHARVPVKQGLCHHFVNEGTLKWRKI